jgi:integrase
MSNGTITRRGKTSWRLKYELPRDPQTSERRTAYVTVKGKRADAEKELRRRLAAIDQGVHVDPSSVTIAEYAREWLTAAELAASTRQRYGELIEQQIVPHLGAVGLQALKPAQVAAWHQTLLREGGKGGRPLSALTVGHAHRVLHVILENAAALEVVGRNVASVVSPPKVQHREIEILTADEIAAVLTGLEGHRLHTLAVLGLGSGCRRGEMLALAWLHVDLDGAMLRVERSLEESDAGGLRFKAPKTKHGRRSISLPASVVDVLRAHRKRQLEQRFALGLGKIPDDALLFSNLEGEALRPHTVSSEWSQVMRARKLPLVSLHALRHTHASALIAAKLDVVAVSRRLGHANPTVTLNIYSHLFENKDDAAAAAIEAAMRRK